MVEPDVRVKI